MTAEVSFYHDSILSRWLVQLQPSPVVLGHTAYFGADPVPYLSAWTHLCMSDSFGVNSAFCCTASF